MNRKNTKENRTKDHSSRMRNGFRDFRILGDRITFIPSIVSKAKTMMFYQASKSKKIFKKKKKKMVPYLYYQVKKAKMMSY